MSDLAGFLLARIAEDEAAAPRFHRLLCMRAACDNDGCIWGEDEDDDMQRERVCTCGYPARVLAECEAKRRIIEYHKQGLDGYGEGEAVCSLCSGGGEYPGGAWWPCPTMRALAAIYADHPGYRDEWKI